MKLTPEQVVEMFNYEEECCSRSGDRQQTDRARAISATVSELIAEVKRLRSEATAMDKNHLDD